MEELEDAADTVADAAADVAAEVAADVDDEEEEEEEEEEKDSGGVGVSHGVRDRSTARSNRIEPIPTPKPN